MTAIEPNPPPRPAHLFDAEQGDSLEDAQSSLLRRLSFFVDTPLSFDGEASGTLHSDESGARLVLRSNLGNGVIVLAPAAQGWIRADVFIAEVHCLRAWLEQAYEEIEFWPDGATGEGEAPGRISKRGAWLTIDCARFPGVSASTGFWTVEATDT